MVKRTAVTSTNRTRSDGRKSLLVYLRHDLIRKLKMAALDEERPAYEITEEAVSQWLERRGRRTPEAIEKLRREELAILDMPILPYIYIELV